MNVNLKNPKYLNNPNLIVRSDCPSTGSGLSGSGALLLVRGQEAEGLVLIVDGRHSPISDLKSKKTKLIFDFDFVSHKIFGGKKTMMLSLLIGPMHFLRLC